jgi:hypothetical protein
MTTKHSLSTLAHGAKTTLFLLSIIALVGAAQAAPQGASPSELLEQGIYSEETKGDIDAAIQLYQQVVGEAKAGQALAAQAQYRLGVCYYKKKNYTEATAAFEKVVKEYPDQKELVTSANDYLANAAVLLPAPWVDGEELWLDVKFPSGFKLGVARYTVAADAVNGRNIWRLGSHLFAGVQQWSRVEVEADSFKPIHSRWKHTLIGDADTTYTPGHAEVKMKGKDEIKKVELTGVFYDNEEAIQLMRRLPLATNYNTTARIFVSLGGGSVLPIRLDVAGLEKVVVPAGTFDCYRVELSIKQTFWYSADEHRYLVKFEGGGVVAELTGVHQHTAGEPVAYQNPTFGFSLTAPPDWIIYPQEKADEKATASIFLLDPEAVALTQLNVQSLESLKPEARKSMRSWAELKIADAAKTVKDFKVRRDGWKELTVAGHPAVGVVADCVEGQENKVLCGVYAFGETTATEFWFAIGANDFEGFRPKFDAIVDSYKTR